MKTKYLLTLLLVSASLPLGFSASAAKLDLTSDADVARDGDDLKVDVRDAIDRDTDVADTVLVFNNAGAEPARVVCRGFDKNGGLVGRRVGTLVPGQGLRYLRASDLSDGGDFIGSAVCWAGGRIHASSVFLAPGAITDLDVVQGDRRRDTRMRFPLVATY